MDVYALIHRAVVERKRVHALVDGRPRKLCPHVLGSRDGEPRALFFQFAGYSSRGLEPGGDWRCLPLHRLTEVTLHDGDWRTTSYSRPQHCITEIDVSVD